MPITEVTSRLSSGISLLWKALSLLGVGDDGPLDEASSSDVSSVENEGASASQGGDVVPLEDLAGSGPQTPGEEEVVNLEEPQWVKTIKAALIAKEITLEGLEGLVGMLKTASNSAKAIKTFRDQHADVSDVKAVSCSKLTGEHLLRMGITTFEAARGDFDPLKVGEHGSEAENLDDQDESEGEQDGSIDADLDGFWRQELRSTFGFLQVCKKLIGNRNEAGGPRHSIFYMLTLVVRIAEHRGALTIIHNELSLGSSRAKDQELEGIIAIIFDNKATLLTGIADFMIFSSEEVNAEEGEAARQGATDANSLFQVTKFFEKFEYVCFLLEAKRPMSSSTQLIQYLPQVIGQCVMIMKRNDTKYMSWCLSDGSQWAFRGIGRDPEGTFSVVYAEKTLQLDCATRDALDRTGRDLLDTLCSWVGLPALTIYMSLKDKAKVKSSPLASMEAGVADVPVAAERDKRLRPTNLLKRPVIHKNFG